MVEKVADCSTSPPVLTLLHSFKSRRNSTPHSALVRSQMAALSVTYGVTTQRCTPTWSNTTRREWRTPSTASKLGKCVRSFRKLICALSQRSNPSSPPLQQTGRLHLRRCRAELHGWQGRGLQAGDHWQRESVCYHWLRHRSAEGFPLETTHRPGAAPVPG